MESCSWVLHDNNAPAHSALYIENSWPMTTFNYIQICLIRWM